jgi:ferritin-like metal-binding protein YciE
MFLYDLSVTLGAEQTMLKGMQEMHRMAQSAPVKQMISQHINESQQQVNNLQQVFGELGQQPMQVPCMAAQGLLDDFRTMARQTQDPALIDLAILGTWSKGEHLEIAAYRSMVEKAQLMGNQRIVQTLQRVLSDEEKTARMVEQAGRDLGQQVIGGKGKAMGGTT